MINKTEELCYLYDKDGNTIDRNKDDVIDESDAVEGLDMSICMDNLLKATERKIALFNGNQSICNGDVANTDGPINAMKAFIRSGCSCQQCSKWPEITWPAVLPNGTEGWTDGCKTETTSFTCYDSDGASLPPEDGTICDAKCSCCGGPRGSTAGTASSCQTTPASPFYTASVYADKDPCTNRQAIDCARQEMNFRISGTGLGLGLKCAGVYDYSADIAPFIDEDNNRLKIIEIIGEDNQTYKAEFLTFKDVVDFDSGINLTGRGRLYSFKNYFDNRIADLNAARDAINNDKNKNILSLAEFQSLQDKSKDSVGIDLFATANNTYDSIAYRSFNCTGYNYNNPNNLCNKGELVNLKNTGWAFLPGEKISNVITSGEGTAIIPPPEVDLTVYSSDHYAVGWPFEAKRIWNNKLAFVSSMNNDLYNSGDPATLYILSNPGTTDPTKYPEAAKAGIIDNSPTKNVCTLIEGSIQTKEKDQIDKETLISRIPIGELTDGLSNYVSQLDGIIESTANEIKNVIYSANEIANTLPEQCDCSLGCGNTDNCSPKPDNNCPGTAVCGAPACTNCETSEQDVCDFGCIDCATTTNIDTAWYSCLTQGSLSGDWSAATNRSFFAAGQMNPLNYRPGDCAIGLDSGIVDNTRFVEIYANPFGTVSSAHNEGVKTKCVCPSSENYYWYDISANVSYNVSCSSLLTSSTSGYGLFCTESQITYILQHRYDEQQTFNALTQGLICKFVNDASGQCNKLIIEFDNIGVAHVSYEPSSDCPAVCSTEELTRITTGGFFNQSSPCFYIFSGLSSNCLKRVYPVEGAQDNFWKISCLPGQPSRFKFTPLHTVASTSCEEDETKLSDEEKNQINDLNPTKVITWIDENNLTWINKATAEKLNCCDMFNAESVVTIYDPYVAAKTLINIPAGYQAICAITDGDSVIKIQKETVEIGSETRPAARKANAEYYVCPYNKIKTEQSKIYKRVASPTMTGLASLGTNQDCLADVPGFLQRIELWRKKLWDFQYANNLEITEENRFTLLDTLNVSRSRFNQCVQGFGQAFKDAATTTYLFTCEEGISAQRLGSLLILPEFPTHNSLLDASLINPQETWNCYPFNSSKLTEQQKIDCFNNKDKNSQCQTYIKNYTNDFYCCQGGSQ